MTSSRERILEMVAQGSISAQEAEQLLAAIDGKQLSRWRLLVDPFDRLGSRVGLVVALVGAVASLGLTALNVRFDGALDLHVVQRPVSLLQGAVDQLAAWICTALVLWLSASVLARRGRFIDFVVSAGVARLPMVIGGLAAGLLLSPAAPSAQELATRSLSVPLLLTLVVVLPCLVWFITILYFGFRTASGLKGGRLAVGFIAALVIAEIAAKFVLWAVHLGATRWLSSS